MNSSPVSFDNTEIAFKSLSNFELKKALFLFKVFQNEFLVKVGGSFTETALSWGLPISVFIKPTIFKHFCSGENLEESKQLFRQLAQKNIGVLLNYGVEAKETDEEYENSIQQNLKAIRLASTEKNIRAVCIKLTGFGRFALFEKLQRKETLNESEQKELDKINARFDLLCNEAIKNSVALYIDAEESWIQEPRDQMTLDRMRIYNKENAIVFNTYQLYRSDKLKDLKQDIETTKNEGFILGAKIVRGAYVEKEAKYAQEHNSTSPIHKNKEGSDADFNEALKSCMDNINQVSLCVASHNEESCLLLTQLLAEKNIPYSHPHICVSQLYGMGDHITYNMASLGINCTKYIPFGPLVDVVPYLIRRAQENGSVNGQMGRELKLLQTEKRRRGI
jgi:proline dehydrogenase